VQCLNKPYPGVWLEGIVDKNQKPSRTLQTNRQTSPLDPDYILPSGPSIMPSGEKVSTQILPYCKVLIDPRSIFCPIWRNFRLLSNSILRIYLQAQTHHHICVHCKCPLSSAYEICNSVGRDLYLWQKFSDRTFNMMLATDDICGAKSQPLYNRPCRCLHEGDPVEEIKGSKPKKWTWLYVLSLFFQQIPMLHLMFLIWKFSKVLLSSKFLDLISLGVTWVDFIFLICDFTASVSHFFASSAKSSCE
jgi:hypothetical protein